MHRFYVETGQIREDSISIIGTDVNHIKNVLRLKAGDKIIICNGQGKDFYCIIESISNSEVSVSIQETKETDTELAMRVTLFQGMPKKDKMELIIQKAVELGVHEIVPVMTKRTIVKLEDGKKEQKKLERWQAIAVSAAKQSGRGVIPQIRRVMSFSEALLYSDSLDCSLIPYEKAENISDTKLLISRMKRGTAGVFIGPEGGFDEQEVLSAAEHGIHPITLGRRILRTETAGLAILSILMFESEE